ncbi:MAG: hypothetical protein AAFY02_03245 [Pseudomonadota bacterium]
MVHRHVSMLLLIAVILPGCSSVMAVTGEEKKDLGVLAKGTPRSVVLAELGAPISSKRGPDVSSPAQAASSNVEPQSAQTASAATAITSEQEGNLSEADAMTAAALAEHNNQPLAAVENEETLAFGEPDRYDIFSFVQGRSSGSNAGRAVAYGALAVLTLGISEVVMTPLEAAAGDQGRMKFRVAYDEEDRVTEARIFDDPTREWITYTEFNRRNDERLKEQQKNQTNQAITE